MTAVEYFVNHGLGGFVGAFRSPVGLARGDRVVVETSRGLELGTVLERVLDRVKNTLPDGLVIRLATDADDVKVQRCKDLADTIVAEAQSRAEALGLPLLFLDGETLLDESTAILQAVHWDECDATPLFESLSIDLGITVRLADISSMPKQGTTCTTCGESKSGCSSCGTGGGCSSGSCSSGSVKNPEELTTFFAGLRKAMEATSDRVSLH